MHGEGERRWTSGRALELLPRVEWERAALARALARVEQIHLIYGTCEPERATDDTGFCPGGTL